jgi:hypothetical protein
MPDKPYLFLDRAEKYFYRIFHPVNIIKDWDEKLPILL